MYCGTLSDRYRCSNCGTWTQRIWDLLLSIFWIGFLFWQRVSTTQNMDNAHSRCVACKGLRDVLRIGCGCCCSRCCCCCCQQALPPDHWIVQEYAADVRARQQLAAISPQQLLDSKSALLSLTQQQTLSHTPKVSTSRRLHLWQRQQEAAIITENHAASSSEHPVNLPEQQQTANRAAHRAQNDQHHATQAQRLAAAAAATAAESVDTKQHPAMDYEEHNGLHTRLIAVTGAAVHQYWCGSWRFELDEAQGGQGINQLACDMS